MNTPPNPTASPDIPSADVRRDRLLMATFKAAIDISDGDRAAALHRLKALPHEDLAVIAISAIQTATLLVDGLGEQIADRLAERAAYQISRTPRPLTAQQTRDNQADLAAELSRAARSRHRTSQQTDREASQKAPRKAQAAGRTA